MISDDSIKTLFLLTLPRVRLFIIRIRFAFYILLKDVFSHNIRGGRAF